jgi:Icc-related predicted phosphoesterase
MNISKKIEMIIPRPVNVEPARQTQMLMERRWEEVKLKPGYDIVDVDDTTTGEDKHVSDMIKIVCMSDTHSTLNSSKFDIPDGDIFIHAGDFTRYGLQSEVEQFNTWLGTLPHRYKVVIGGNHELCFDPKTYEEGKEYMKQVGEYPSKGVDDMKKILTNCVYLEDNSVDVLGIKIYGSPWQPVFSHSAFNLLRGPDLQSRWSKIPTNTDILVTHGPPLGVRDASLKNPTPGTNTGPSNAGRAGCEDLLLEVVERVRPKFHIFGHIHEGDKKGLIFFNCVCYSLQAMDVLQMEEQPL